LNLVLSEKWWQCHPSPSVSNLDGPYNSPSNTICTTLGVPHAWASFIWFCGPISGLLVQPIIGYSSDRCQCAFSRRRPFILAGTIAVTISIILIGYAADIGQLAGDDIT